MSRKKKTGIVLVTLLVFAAIEGCSGLLSRQRALRGRVCSSGGCRLGRQGRRSDDCLGRRGRVGFERFQFLDCSLVGRLVAAAKQHPSDQDSSHENNDQGYQTFQIAIHAGNLHMIMRFAE